MSQPQPTWQDLLNLLTHKGFDTGVILKVKNSPEDLMKFKHSYDENKPYLEEWLATKVRHASKSSSKSIEFRVAGNKVYQKGKDVEALNFYNLSTISAPLNTNDFALAVSNRSAVLGRLNYFKEAIRDVDLALQHGNQEIPRKKLLIRKALFLHKLHLYKDSLAVIKSLFPDEIQIRNNENVDLRKAYFDALEKSKSGKAKCVVSEPSHNLPVPKGGLNDKFPSASALVSLKYSTEKGRYVVANEYFEKSDIIFVEKPFALVVLPDQYKQHCHHCCKRLVVCMPCKECTRATFCSEQCSEEAWSRYHQWECRGLEVYHSVGIAHLGLRLALMADDTDRYRQVCDLVTHIEEMKEEDIYMYSVTAVLLTLYLEKYTPYFSNRSSPEVQEMGCRIMRHIAQLVCNGHAITKVDSKSMEQEGSKTESEEHIRIATAIYPSASMMNHSCDQNISNNFINECLVVTANRPIKKGEEVSNCYGPSHRTMSTSDRQQALQDQYFFKCKCPWCSNPSKKEYHQFTALQCQFCYGPVMKDQAGCADCGKGQPLAQLMDMHLVAQQAFHKCQQYFKKGDLKTALTLCEECVKLSSKCLYKHNRDLRFYKDFLARIYVEMGRYDESFTIVEDSIESVEAQFGKDSVELEKETSKLFDLITLDLKKMKENGKQNSEQYRLKQQKMENLIQKITGEKVTLPVDFPEMVAAVNNSLQINNV